jgi:hypothetical protein
MVRKWVATSVTGKNRPKPVCDDSLLYGDEYSIQAKRKRVSGLSQSRVQRVIFELLISAYSNHNLRVRMNISHHHLL